MKGMSDAKRQVLQELRKQMMKEDDMGLGKMLGSKVKKVTVMSDSEEGLEKGMDKAKEIMKKRLASKGFDEKEMEDESEMEEDMEDEMEGDELAEGEGCECGKCPECLQAKIDKLEDKLEA